MFVTGNISSRFPRVPLHTVASIIPLPGTLLPQREGVTVHQKMHAYMAGHAVLPPRPLPLAFQTALFPTPKLVFSLDFRRQMAPRFSFRQVATRVRSTRLR